MSEIGVKLGGDNSEFRAMLSRSAADAQKFAGQISGQVSKKVLDIGHVGNVVAAALGFNLKEIADNIARWYTGVTKAEEEALQKLESLTTQVADANIKNMRAQLTEEQRYQLALQDRDALLHQIEDSNARTAEEMVKQKMMELKLAEKSAEVIQYESKLRAEAAKAAEAAAKAEVTAAEKLVQTQLNALDGAEKIAALKENIAATQAVISSGVLDQASTERLTLTLNERKIQLVAEEAKLKEELGKVDQKNADALAKADAKSADAAREDLSLAERRKVVKAELATLEKFIAAGLAENRDVTKEIGRAEELRGELRANEKAQAEATLEIAKLLLKGTENLTEEDKLRLELLRGQTTQGKINLEIADLTAKAVAGTLTPAERERLAVLVGQSAEIKRQVGDMNNLTRAAKEFVQTITRSGSSYESQSTAALQGVRDRVKSQLDQVTQENLMTAPRNRNPFQYALENEYASLQRELELRQSVGQYVQRYGEDAARGQFGDSIVNRALRDMTDQATQTTQTLTRVEELLKKSPFFGGG
jgi:hypothetical protein